MSEIISLYTSDGVELVADIAGPAGAPVIVFVPGGGQRRHTWSRTAQRAAAAGYRACSIDLRGHGDSSWPEHADYRAGRFAQDLRELGGLLGGRPAFVGASLGGIASALAVGESPFLPASAIVLVDVAHRPVQSGSRKILEFMQGGLEGFASLEDAAAVIGQFLSHREPPSMEAVSRNLRQRPDGKWAWHWDPRFVELDRKMALSFDHDRIGRAIAAAPVPMMLVRGGSSEIVSPEIVDEMRALRPDIHYVDVPAATHMVAGDDNDAFMVGLIDFLRLHMSA